MIYNELALQLRQQDAKRKGQGKESCATIVVQLPPRTMFGPWTSSHDQVTTGSRRSALA